MYGTVAHLHVKPGGEQSVVGLMNEWTQERKSKTDGFNAAYLYREDNEPGTFILVASFRDQESYRANASDTDQDGWFKRVRSHLIDDPVWEDGEIVASL